MKKEIKIKGDGGFWKMLHDATEKIFDNLFGSNVDNSEETGQAHLSKEQIQAQIEADKFAKRIGVTEPPVTDGKPSNHGGISNGLKKQYETKVKAMSPERLKEMREKLEGREI